MLLLTDHDLSVIIQEDRIVGDIALNQVLGLEEPYTAQHLDSSISTFG